MIFVQRREKSERVSPKWIRRTARIIFENKKIYQYDKYGLKYFMGSFGSMRPFVTDQNKIRRCKCVK